MAEEKSMQIDEVLARLNFLANSAESHHSREFYFHLIGKLSELKVYYEINKNGEKVKNYYETIGDVVKNKVCLCYAKLNECTQNCDKFFNYYNSINEASIKEMSPEARYVEEYKIYTHLRDENLKDRNFIALKKKVTSSVKDIESLKYIVGYVGCQNEILIFDKLSDSVDAVLTKCDLAVTLSKKYSNPKPTSEVRETVKKPISKPLDVKTI